MAKYKSHHQVKNEKGKLLSLEVGERYNLHTGLPNKGAV